MFHLCYADAIRKTIPRKRGGDLLKGVISMVRLIMGEKGTGKTKKLIEKFVDENPDAAALLLRNWLNDDWE